MPPKTKSELRMISSLSKGSDSADSTCHFSEIEKMKLEIKSKELELVDKERMIDMKESEIKQLQEELQKTEKKRNVRGERLADLYDELKTAESKIAELEKQAEKRLNDEQSILSSERKVLENKLKENDTEIAELKERLRLSQREIETLQEELQTMKNELDEKRAMIAETDSKLHTLEQKLKATETEKQDYKKCIDDLKIELKTAQRLRDEHEIKENKKEIAKLKNDLSASESKVKDLEKQIEMNKTKHSDQMMEERKSLENKFKEKDKEINELRKCLSKSESEVKYLKDEFRLSKAMEITENNPDIADLCDLNRPTKLAERYSELFDYEWTDAFEELENNGMKSRQILDELYYILKDVYIFSQKVSYDYGRNVSSTALTIPGEIEEKPKTLNLNLSARKQLVYLKKTFAPLLAGGVFKLYMYLKQCKEYTGPKTKKFIGVCTEICWLMSVQDPPLVLDIEEPNGGFDKDKYRFYQRSGKQVDFIVWPPMKLHEGGPLLAKGVAEGK